MLVTKMDQIKTKIDLIGGFQSNTSSALKYSCTLSCALHSWLSPDCIHTLYTLQFIVLQFYRYFSLYWLP